MNTPRILLTNDDGIDAPGLAALYEELTGVADVTVVAPAEEQSGVGRTRSKRVVRRSHPWGYSLAGTPADCVAYGLRGLDEDFDLVVSGCNHGPNAGNYVVGRSGTVGAGVEAGFLGTPALAVSAYHAADFFVHPPEEYDFSRPSRIAAELVERALNAGIFEDIDLVNLNAPVDVEEPPVQVTRPYPDYDLVVEHEGDAAATNTDGGSTPAWLKDATDVEASDDGKDGGEVIALHDSTWPDVVGFTNPFPPTDEYRERYPVGSDRRALMDGAISVSPLSVTMDAAESQKLAELLEDW
ncbi:MAG: 5'-nucleotidase [Halobacteriales archaeon]|jgi:5'-nucleotidase